MTEHEREPLQRRSELRPIATDSIDAGQKAIAQPQSRSRARDRKPPGSQWAKILRYYHGMRPEQWQAMRDEQGGCCYLCERPLPANQNKVVIDHDHECCPQNRSCGFCRRGLACGSCNSGIGFFCDDPALLRLAADNLERAKELTAALMLTKPEQGELLEREA